MILNIGIEMASSCNPDTKYSHRSSCKMYFTCLQVGKHKIAHILFYLNNNLHFQLEDGSKKLVENKCADQLLFDETSKSCINEDEVIQKQPRCSPDKSKPKGKASKLTLLLQQASSITTDLELNHLNIHQSNLSKFSSKFEQFSKLTELPSAQLITIERESSLYFEFTRLLNDPSLDPETQSKIEKLRSILLDIITEVNPTQSTEFTQKVSRTKERLKQVQLELWKIEQELPSSGVDASQQYQVNDITKQETKITQIIHGFNEILYELLSADDDKLNSQIVNKVMELQRELKDLKLNSLNPVTVNKSIESIDKLLILIIKESISEEKSEDADICTGSMINAVVPNDCSSFYHCNSFQATGKLVKKKCGPGTMFNPVNLICDWPLNVYKVRPECKISQDSTVSSSSSTTSSPASSSRTSTSYTTSGSASSSRTSTSSTTSRSASSSRTSTSSTTSSSAAYSRTFTSSTTSSLVSSSRTSTLSTSRPAFSSKTSTSSTAETKPPSGYGAGITEPNAETSLGTTTFRPTTQPATTLYQGGYGGLLFTIPKISPNSNTTYSNNVFTSLLPNEKEDILYTTLPSAFPYIVTEVSNDPESILIVQSTKSPPLPCPPDR